MLLREIAHSRTGDKGNLVTISVIAYRATDFPLLETQLTVDRVNQCFAEFLDGSALRYVIPKLNAIIFVLKRPLNQGVTRSLALDAHGKCLGSALLGLELSNIDGR